MKTTEMRYEVLKIEHGKQLSSCSSELVAVSIKAEKMSPPGVIYVPVELAKLLSIGNEYTIVIKSVERNEKATPREPEHIPDDYM